MERTSSQGQATSLMTFPALAVILFVWAIVSFFPIFSIIQNEKTVFWITLQLIFLATGFLGVGTVVAFVAVTVQRASRLEVRKAISGKLGVASVYATLWLAAYGAASKYLTP